MGGLDKAPVYGTNLPLILSETLLTVANTQRTVKVRDKRKIHIRRQIGPDPRKVDKLGAVMLPCSV